MDFIELSLLTFNELDNIDVLVHQLKNLRRLKFKNINLNDLSKFIQHSAELTKIKVNHLSGIELDFSRTLSILNEKRKYLKDAEKVTIYVDEECFVELKWLMDGNIIF